MNLQVLPGPTALERRRLALLFDCATGQVVRGMRAWREIRCTSAHDFAKPDGRSLGATWAAAVAPSPAASRVELSELGLTVHASAGRLVIETGGGDLANGHDPYNLVVRRSFSGGVCRSTRRNRPTSPPPMRPPTVLEVRPLAQGCLARPERRALATSFA